MSETTPARTGGQMIAASLADHGVEAVFCVPGESYLEVLDALNDHPNIQVIACRHEHGAADMAEAYAKLTGRVGVCMVTRGPGACNASIGVHTAFQDSTPMILLVGQVPVHFQGREAFQEVDYTQMFAPLAKDAVEIRCTEDAPAMMADAFRVAMSDRRGPVVVALPEDVLSGRAEVSAPVPSPVVVKGPEAGDLTALGELLSRAERPVLMVGGGGWTEEAKAAVQAFAERNRVPTCCSFRRLDILDNASTVYAGEMGIAPNPKLLERVRAADLVMVMGARLGEMTSQGYALFDAPNPKQTLVHVHGDETALGRVFKPTLSVHANVAAFAEALSAIGIAGDAAARQNWCAEARRDFEDWQSPPAYGGDLDLGQVMMTLRARLPANAVISVDAGNFSGWPQRFLRYGKRRFVGATNGAMGYGVPGAVAAKVAFPGRVAVGFAGDGGFGMTGQEIATAMQLGVDPLIIVFNNGMYGTIRMHQEREHPGRVIATDLHNPDFAELARSYGAHGEAVERTDDFAPALDRALKAGRAALIELRMNPDQITTRGTLADIREAALKRQEEQS